MAQTQFASTPEMSTHSIGFVISKFTPANNVTNEDDEFVYNIVTKPDLNDYTNIALRFIPDLVNRMGAWTGLKYEDMGDPQFVVVAAEYLGSNGVPSWGVVIDREENLLNEGSDADTSAKQKQRILQTLANHVAHQWFGDYMTPDWWSNAWISEGFSKFFEYYLINDIDNELQTDYQFAVDVFQDSLYQDSILGYEGLSVGEDLTTVDILQKMDRFVSMKGASILRMMQSIVGDDKFQEGVRTLLDKNTYNHTTPSILFESLGIKEEMNTWLYKSGYPLVTANLNKNGDSVVLSQEPFFLVSNDMNTADWIVPITYATSEDIDFSTKDVTWFKPGEDLTISLPTDSWIILNKQQRGYFRVNYDDALWDRIIKVLKGSDRTKIHFLNRAQLIDDIFAVASVGKVSYENVFRLLDYLQHETDYYPWVTALRAMSKLLDHIGNEKVTDMLKGKIRSLLKAAFPDVNEINGSSHVDKLKESLILNWKCFAEDIDCLSAATSKYQDFKNTKSFQNYNERDLILCSGAKYSEIPTFEYSYLLNIYQSSKSNIEKEAILKAIGCITDNATLKQYLMDLVMEQSLISSYDAMKVFEAVSSQNHGTDIALQFLEEMTPQIINKFNGILNLSEFVFKLADKISNRNQLERLKNVVANNEELEDDRSIRSLKIIEFNTQWSEKYADEIYNILENPAGDDGIISTCNIYLISLLFINLLMFA